MQKVLKKSIVVAGIIVCLLLVAWCALIAYVHYNKESVLAALTAQLNENLQGKLAIGSMEPALLKGFPGVAVTLRDVTLEDSLFAQHGQRLLTAREVFLSVNIWSVVRGSPHIEKLTVENADINIFTDSNGYSNTSIFKAQKKEKTDTRASIQKLSLRTVTLKYRHYGKQKLFRLAIDFLHLNRKENAKGWKSEISTRTQVQECNFNTAKGSFLKNKTLNARLKLFYDEAQQILTVPEQSLKIDDQQIDVKAAFNLSETPISFTLNFNAEDILYKTAAGWLSPSISKKLANLDLTKPINVQSSIVGVMKYRDTPIVNVQWQVHKNELTLPVGVIEKCSFTGYFTNEKTKGLGRNDPNSLICLFGFEGSWTDIPFTVDTLLVSNLIHPLLQGKFQSQFPLSRLNAVIGGNSFQFKEGDARLNLTYRGGISQKDTNKAYVYGTVGTKNATVAYLPRGLEFRNSTATIVFKGRDVFINKVRLAQGKSVLNMEGSLMNFLSLYYTDPGSMKLKWRIQSDAIDLSDFTAFLAARKSKPTTTAADNKSRGDAVRKLSTQMDRVLAESNVDIGVELGKLQYRKFLATNVKASLLLGTSAIELRNVSVNHAGGDISLSGVLHQKGNVNDFAVKALVQNVAVRQFFEACNNFGQDAITSENIRGALFAESEITGRITDDGRMVPYSIEGTTSFDLRNGALINFSPIQKIGKLVFRNRDVSNIEVRSLKNTLTLRGNKVIIPSMYIESSVLNVRTEGVYSFGKGTDIDIYVPLKNPKRSELIVDDSLRQKKGMKGLVLRLKAVDGTDGNVKITWKP